MDKTGAQKVKIELKPVEQEEIETVWKMQVEAFSDLLQKYQDYETSPAAEKIGRAHV